MDYLENKILLCQESEYKDLYPWSLQEFDKENIKIGRDQIPWLWSLYFTTSELQYECSIRISAPNKFFTEKNEEQLKESECIAGILYPGTCGDGKRLKNTVSYSMFGTNREINKFDLFIFKLEENSGQRKVHISGRVHYAEEENFMDEVIDDTVTICLYLPSQQFNKFAELIKSRCVDIFTIRLSQVSGFYSDWSPSIDTSNIKILGDPTFQKIIMQDGCEIDPPRLGDVGEFNMSIVQRHKLNLKQDLKSVSPDKLFEEFDNYEEEFLEKQKHQNSPHEQDSSILAQLVCNEAILQKIHHSIWLIFIGLCVLLVKLIF